MPSASASPPIIGPSGFIEATVEEPSSSTAGSSTAGGTDYAVVCHPHPPSGGTMTNKVVTTLARALADCGVPSLRFNFRGVGASAGVYDEGVGETADAAAVADWGARRWPGRRLILAGFSFGAFVALRLSRQRATAQLITVAPPLQRFDFSDLQAPLARWLILQGDADELVDAQAVIRWAASLSPKPRVVVFPGVGHFFPGRLQELRAAVTDEIRSGQVGRSG
jgi:alpha/beta superfamily hydrolase